MSAWREALGGSLVEVFVADDDVRPHRSSPVAAPSKSRAQIAYEVGDALIEQFRDRISTVAEIAEMWQIVTEVIRESAEVDTEVRDRRVRGRYWRESMPELVEAFIPNGARIGR